MLTLSAFSSAIASPFVPIEEPYTVLFPSVGDWMLVDSMAGTFRVSATGERVRETSGCGTATPLDLARRGDVVAWSCGTENRSHVSSRVGSTSEFPEPILTDPPLLRLTEDGTRMAALRPLAGLEFHRVGTEAPQLVVPTSYSEVKMEEWNGQFAVTAPGAHLAPQGGLPATRTVGVVVYDVDGKQLWARELSNERATPLTWSSDGREILVADGSRLVRFDARTGATLAETDERALAVYPRANGFWALVHVDTTVDADGAWRPGGDVLVALSPDLKGVHREELRGKGTVCGVRPDGTAIALCAEEGVRLLADGAWVPDAAPTKR